MSQNIEFSQADNVAVVLQGLAAEGTADEHAAERFEAEPADMRLEKLRSDVAAGLMYAHGRENANTSKVPKPCNVMHVAIAVRSPYPECLRICSIVSNQHPIAAVNSEVHVRPAFIGSPPKLRIDKKLITWRTYQMFARKDPTRGNCSGQYSSNRSPEIVSRSRTGRQHISIRSSNHGGECWIMPLTPMATWLPATDAPA